MRFTAGCGCLVAALDSVRHATVPGHQLLFAAGYEWVWWLAAVAWLIAAVSVWVRGVP